MEIESFYPTPPQYPGKTVLKGPGFRPGSLFSFYDIGILFLLPLPKQGKEHRRYRDLPQGSPCLGRLEQYLCTVFLTVSGYSGSLQVSSYIYDAFRQIDIPPFKSADFPDSHSRIEGRQYAETGAVIFMKEEIFFKKCHFLLFGQYPPGPLYGRHRVFRYLHLIMLPFLYKSHDPQDGTADITKIP